MLLCYSVDAFFYLKRVLRVEFLYKTKKSCEAFICGEIIVLFINPFSAVHSSVKVENLTSFMVI